MSDEWDSDCELALEALCTEIANGDEARALLAMLPAVRAALSAAYKAGQADGSAEREYRKSEMEHLAYDGQL